MDVAVDRVERAIADRSLILLYGDYGGGRHDRRGAAEDRDRNERRSAVSCPIDARGI
jgi:hypothetical protein